MGFSKDVQKWGDKALRRVRYVARTATLDVVNDALISTAKGGNMRVDTGFLRASGQAKIGAMPSGPTSNPDREIYGENELAKGAPIGSTLLRWQAEKERFYFGFTANYARYREYKDGYLRAAAMQWQDFVRSAVKQSKVKIK